MDKERESKNESVQPDKSLAFRSICIVRLKQHACEWRTIVAKHKIKFNQIESVTSSNNGWEPPIILQKNSTIHILHTCIRIYHWRIDSPLRCIFWNHSPAWSKIVIATVWTFNLIESTSPKKSRRTLQIKIKHLKFLYAGKRYTFNISNM